MATSVILATLATVAAFQDYSLGMTLEEARIVPVLEADFGPIKLTCSSDADAPRSLTVTDAEKRVGVEKCWPTQWIGKSHTRASIALGGGINATTEFLFFNGKLFQIETIYDEMHRALIEKALREKFGSPSGRVDSAVQNLYGAEFEQNLLAWDVGDDKVTLVAPAFTLRRMVVSYNDVEISKRVKNTIEANEVGELSL